MGLRIGVSVYSHNPMPIALGAPLGQMTQKKHTDHPLSDMSARHSVPVRMNSMLRNCGTARALPDIPYNLYIVEKNVFELYVLHVARSQLVAEKKLLQKTFAPRCGTAHVPCLTYNTTYKSYTSTYSTYTSSMSTARNL